MQQTYGGSGLALLQLVTAENNPSAPHSRHLIWPNPEVNPFLPTHAGAAGMMFSCRQEITENGQCSLFYRVAVKPNAVWRYLGEYINRLAGPMPPEEFASQRASVGCSPPTYIYLISIL